MKTISTKICQISFLSLLLFFSANVSAQWSEIGGAGFSPSYSQRNATAVSGSTLYMAYMDGSGNATVMKSTGSTWSVVGTGSFSPSGSTAIDIAVNASGVPYVAFVDNAAKVRVMNFNGTAWAVVGAFTIATSMTSQDIDLEFDNTNAPCVLFSDQAVSSKLSVYRFSGSAWAPLGTAGFSAGSSTIMSMAKSPSTGALYVAYQDNANLNTATIMTYSAGSWSLVGTAGGGSPGSQITDIDIAVNNSGTPHIIYPDFSNSNKSTIRFFNGTVWAVLGAAGISAGASSYNGITFNSTGTAYVAYRDGGNSARATAMMYNGTAWTTIGTAGFSGSTVTAVSILINSAGQPCVGYSDVSVSSRATMMKYCSSATSSILSVSAGTVCGSGTVSISGTASAGGSIYWYTAPTNGSFISGNNTFTQTASSNFTYYAAAVDVNGCVSAPRMPVTVTVVPIPTIFSTSSATICTGSSAVIGAVAGVGQNVNWYTGAFTGTLLATGNSYTTPVQNTAGNVVFYAEANDQGCANLPRTAVTVTVRATPTMTISGATNICNGNSTNLLLNGSAITTVTWSTGANTMTVSLSPTLTTVYTATAGSGQGCFANKSVTVTVSPCTGINETQTTNGTININPNPNNGEFTLIVPEEGMYRIVNSIGQTVETIAVKENSQAISIQGLADGIYYVIGKSAKAKIVVSK